MGIIKIKDGYLMNIGSKNLIVSLNDLGTPEEIIEALNRAISLLKGYKVLGTPKEISEVLEEASQLFIAYKKLKNDLVQELPESISNNVTDNTAQDEGFQKELDVVRKELREDEGYYIAWQANIAMAFVDEFSRYKKNHNKTTVSKVDVHEIANNAAKYFLDLLIKD